MTTTGFETTTVLYPQPAEGAVQVTVHLGVLGTTAWVTAKILPGYSWWSQPDAKTLRRLVDQAAAEQGLRRNGPRVEGQHQVSTWRWTYPLTTKENQS